MKDECSMLKLQLKEKDELISQLQEELVSVNDSCSMGVFPCKAIFSKPFNLFINTKIVSVV